MVLGEAAFPEKTEVDGGGGTQFAKELIVPQTISSLEGRGDKGHL